MGVNNGGSDAALQYLKRVLAAVISLHRGDDVWCPRRVGESAKMSVGSQIGERRGSRKHQPGGPGIIDRLSLDGHNGRSAGRFTMTPASAKVFAVPIRHDSGTGTRQGETDLRVPRDDRV